MLKKTLCVSGLLGLLLTSPHSFAGNCFKKPCTRENDLPPSYAEATRMNSHQSRSRSPEPEVNIRPSAPSFDESEEVSHRSSRAALEADRELRFKNQLELEQHEAQIKGQAELQAEKEIELEKREAQLQLEQEQQAKKLAEIKKQEEALKLAQAEKEVENLRHQLALQQQQQQAPQAQAAQETVVYAAPVYRRPPSNSCSRNSQPSVATPSLQNSFDAGATITSTVLRGRNHTYYIQSDNSALRNIYEGGTVISDGYGYQAARPSHSRSNYSSGYSSSGGSSDNSFSGPN